MGLFSPSSTTLEARLADSVEALRLASAQVATLTDDLQTAVTLASTRETLATQLANDLDKERIEKEIHLATAILAGECLNAAFAPFNFSEEIRATLIPDNITTAIAAEIEARAGRRAVELAASQGTPALATDTTTSNPEQDLVATFEAASPEVRAQMFADPITRAALRRANNSV